MNPITQIPCLQDNYSYLIVCETTGQAVMVDPAEGPKIASVLKAQHIQLTAIFNTHHHWDHVEGNAYLCAQFPDVVVYGSQYDLSRNRITHQTRGLKEGDRLSVGTHEFHILDIPGHTLGHIAYVGQQMLFCGDTLFSGGCGRLFEGTPAMMVDSLSKLRALPDTTQVYCGHEYTQRNLEFALSLEPSRQSIIAAYEAALTRRQAGLSTVPSTLAQEKLYNPFLRFDDLDLKAAVEKKIGASLATDVDVFAAIRVLKDRF